MRCCIKLAYKLLPVKVQDATFWTAHSPFAQSAAVRVPLTPRSPEEACHQQGLAAALLPYKMDAHILSLLKHSDQVSNALTAAPILLGLPDMLSSISTA